MVADAHVTKAGQTLAEKILVNSFFVCRSCSPEATAETVSLSYEQARSHSVETGHDDWTVSIPVRETQ